MMAEKVLIFGVGGFIGANLLNIFSRYFPKSDLAGVCSSKSSNFTKKRMTFLKQNVDNKIYEIEKYDDIEDVFSDFEPTIVINCAGVVNSKDDINQLVESNCLLPTILINNVKSKYLNQYIHLSTIDVFLAEKILEFDTPVYAYSKCVAERFVIDACVRKGINFKILRPSTVYGELMHPERLTVKAFRAVKENKTLELSKGVAKNFVSVIDIAELLQEEMLKSASAIYNLCSKETYFLSDYFEIVRQSLGFKPELSVRSRAYFDEQDNLFRSSIQHWEGGTFSVAREMKWERATLQKRLMDLFLGQNYSVADL